MVKIENNEDSGEVVGTTSYMEKTLTFEIGTEEDKTEVDVVLSWEETSFEQGLEEDKNNLVIKVNNSSIKIDYIAEHLTHLYAQNIVDGYISIQEDCNFIDNIIQKFLEDNEIEQ